jgi:hypothetical protein
MAAQVIDLQQANARLRTENNELRERIDAYAQTGEGVYNLTLSAMKGGEPGEHPMSRLGAPPGHPCPLIGVGERPS